MGTQYQTCTRCVSDTTFPGIRFDADGVCNYCKAHDVLETVYPEGAIAQERLGRIVERIKKAGRGKEYDCVVGTSGGRDSTYCLYSAVKLGLRPLAVHFDNGWNSDVAVTNIRNSCEKLGVDLHTHVADWQEFRDLQIAFLKASVPEAEIPTDIAIHGALHEVACQEGIEYIILGHSFRTEGICPKEWTYMDGKYIKTIRRTFGQVPQKTVPNITLGTYLYYTMIKRVKVIPILNYLSYRHADVRPILEKECGWTYYGGHHHESQYTKFFQSYLLPKKFNIDKRKLEYSALIRSGQKTRAAALKEITECPYAFDEELVEYCIQKLELTRAEFDQIMATPPRSFRDYSTNYPLIASMRLPITWLYKMGLCPPILYLKFFS